MSAIGLKRIIWAASVIIELFLFSGVAFGFPFLDFELKSEGVFYNTKCSNGTSDIWTPGTPLCPGAITLYNTLFTIAVVSCTIGVFLVGFILNKIGMFWTRMIYCTITTLGYVMMALYKTNELLLFPGLALLGWSGLGYLVLNNVCVSIMGKFAGLSIIIFSGTFDASSATFLVLSKLTGTFDLNTMFGVLAILSLFVHFRTFFMMPYDFPGKDFAEGNFLSSTILGKCCRPDEIVENKEEKEKVEEKEKIPLMQSCKDPTFIAFLIVFVIYSTRVKAIQGWIYPWMEWSYAKIDADQKEIDEHVGNLLEIYGLLLFASPLFAAMPEFFSWIGSKLNRNGVLNGDMISLTIIMSYSAIACSVNSGQMVYRATSLDDNANAYALIVLFSIAKTIVYAAPNMFLFYMFPAEHFGSLYGVLTAPGIITMWFIDPLFRVIVGDNALTDADFAPVSIGFAIICGVCLLQVFIPKYGLIPAAKRMSRKNKPVDAEKEISNDAFEKNEKENLDSLTSL